jgi:hypothetical protein
MGLLVWLGAAMAGEIAGRAGYLFRNRPILLAF